MKNNSKYITRNNESPLYDKNSDVVNLRETTIDLGIK